ncbi:MAG: GNAT family N-acetyltransferase [Clostridia bacterium]|nr:GNAT family N-acetyltransferase [Clostridia bacterium]
MDIIRLTLDTLTDSIFEQMVDIEANCGIFSYPPDVLRECIRIGDTYACMDDETVAGFITVDPAATDYFDTSLHIVNVNVATAYRRQGLAQMMIRTVCGYYANSHAGLMVTLDVEKTNVPARSLYEKLGFVASDMSSENGPTDLVMVVALEQLIA